MKKTTSKLMSLLFVLQLSLTPPVLAQAPALHDPRAEGLSEPMDISFEEVHISRAPAELAPYLVVLETDQTLLDPEARREDQLSRQESFLLQAEIKLGRCPDLLEHDVYEGDSLTLNLLKAEARALARMDGVRGVMPLESPLWPSADLSAQVDETHDVKTREVPQPVTLHVSQNLANAGSTLIYTLTIPVNRTSADLDYFISDVLPAGVSYYPDSLRTTGSDIPATYTYDELIGSETIQWQGTVPHFELHYDMSDNTTNPTYCKMPLFEGAYVDILTRYGTPTNSAVHGDGIAFTLGVLGVGSEYFGEVIPYRPRFTDDGYVLMNSEEAYTHTSYETNEILPHPNEPNGLLSLLWRDMFISYDEAANKGVTAKYFTDAWLVEFDGIEDYWLGYTMDFEVFAWLEPDPEMGWPDIIFAYDNVMGDWYAWDGNMDDPLPISGTYDGSIGIENADGTHGYGYAYDNFVPQSGDIICFDYVEVGKDPVIITFAVNVDPELEPGTIITNSAEYLVDEGDPESVMAGFMVNDIPVANPQSLTTDEDVPLSILLTGSDTYPGGDLIFKITQPSTGTAIADGALPNLIYTPKLDFYGTDSFTFTVGDGLATSAPATITIVVLPVNDPPVAWPQTVITPSNTPVEITLVGTDIDGDDLTDFTVISEPLCGTLSGTAAILIYTPDMDFFGNDSFSFIVNDGEYDSNEAWVTITVNSPNWEIFLPLITR